MSAMLSLEEAQARLLALAPAMPATQLEITPGMPLRYLAQDLHALRTQPSADLSAMDGYAIGGDGPWKRVGESRAGEPFVGEVAQSQCTRISTGAHMPRGTDRVLIQENAEVEGDRVMLRDGEILPEQGRHVRKAGFDFSEGDIALRKGARTSAATMALAIAAGHLRLPVVAPPRVAVLDSGDELAPLGSPVGPHQIPASNGTMIAAMIAPLVSDIQMLGPVPDEHGALADALGKSEDSDILITSGGASVGDHDLVQDALREWGAKIDFWKVAIKPGKPLMIAARGKQVIIGLPGNPVSSFVTAFLFVLPLIRAATGDANPLPKRQRLIAGVSLPAVGPRQEFLRGVHDGERVKLAASQDSSALQALASANCLIDRPSGSATVDIGDPVWVYNLQNGGNLGC